MTDPPLKKIKHLGCTFIRSCGDVVFVKVFKEERIIYRTFAWMTKLFVEAHWWRYNLHYHFSVILMHVLFAF